MLAHSQAVLEVPGDGVERLADLRLAAGVEARLDHQGGVVAVEINQGIELPGIDQGVGPANEVLEGLVLHAVLPVRWFWPRRQNEEPASRAGSEWTLANPP